MYVEANFGKKIEQCLFHTIVVVLNYNLENNFLKKTKTKIGNQIYSRKFFNILKFKYLSVGYVSVSQVPVFSD